MSAPQLARERFRLAHRIARRAWPKPDGSWLPEVAVLETFPWTLQKAATGAVIGGRSIGRGDRTYDALNCDVHTRLSFKKAGCGVHL